MSLGREYKEQEQKDDRKQRSLCIVANASTPFLESLPVMIIPEFPEQNLLQLTTKPLLYNDNTG
jgi:hypothetical protein